MLLAISLALAEPYALANAGVTLNLPAGWEMSRWSDWDFKARHPGGLAMELWYTPWQIPADTEVYKGFTRNYEATLADQRAGAVVVSSVKSAAAGGNAFIHSELGFRFDNGDGPPGVLHVAAFPGDGKVIHLAIYAASPNAGRAAAALDAIVSRTQIDKPPAPTATLTGAQPTKLGFAVNLPEGWRMPLATEQEEVTNLASATGAGDISACFVAARPAPEGGDLAILCQASWMLGVLTERSWDDISVRLKDGMFGKAAGKLAPPDKLTLPDRLGFRFRPEINDHDLRVAVVPYERGAIHGWAIGPLGAGAELDSGLEAIASGIKYEGANNGLAKLPFGENLTYILTYEPFHPGVLCCVGATLVFMSGIGFLVFRKKPAPPSYHV